MIVIRGKTIEITPLTFQEGVGVQQSVLVLGTCTPTTKVRLPENFPHLVRVVAVVARRQIPDVTLDEVSAALNHDNFSNVLNALMGGQYPSLAETHQEHSNVRQ